MSTYQDQRPPQTTAIHVTETQIPATIALQPIAAPSVLGLFGFAGATFIVAAHMAGWYGSDSSGLYLAPFAAFFGGLAQFMAGMWAYRGRDEIATAMHGMWGAFWMAYGLLNLLFATGTLTEPKPEFAELGFWFIALGAITFMGMVGAAVEGNFGVTAVLGTLGAGSALAAIAFLTGGDGWEKAAGYVFIGSAALAFYVASAMMIGAAAGRVVLPLVKAKHEANVPGEHVTIPIEWELGEPGVRKGQ